MVVRYYSRMRLHRVYPLSVEVSRSTGGAAGLSTPVTVRPLVAGAIVVPPERKLDAGQPGAKVEFQVTALAKGRLRGALVEIHQPGQVVQAIPLRVKGTTQMMTLLLALLTILIPVGLWLLVIHPLSGSITVKVRGKPAGVNNAPQGQDNQPPGNRGGPRGPRRGGDQGKQARPDQNRARREVIAPKAVADADADQIADALPALLVLLQPDPGQGRRGGGPPDGFPPRGGMPEMQPAPKDDSDEEEQVETASRAGTPDEVLRDRLRTWLRARLPDDPPKFCTIIATESHGPKFYKDAQGEENDVAGWVSWGYKWVRTLTEDGWWFYTGMVLFGMTIGSWILHSSARGARRQVVMLTAPYTQNAGETLPLTGRDEPPTLEPVD
jgi:hypothetical protein